MKVFPKYLHITLVTANMLKGQPLSHPKEDLQWITTTWAPDIIGCQESESYRQALSSVPGYGYCMPDGAPEWALEDPIVYNTATMRLVGSSYVRAADGKAHRDPPRYIVVAHFVTRVDGIDVWYFNTHAHHHIEPGVSQPDSPQTAEAIQHFKLMAEMVQARAKAPNSIVFWGGDLNVDENKDNTHKWKGFPAAVFGAHNMTSVYDDLKLDPPGRTIDIIGSSNDDPGVTAVSCNRSGTQVHSDHQFVRAIYSIPRAEGKGGGATQGPTVLGSNNLPIYDPNAPGARSGPGGSIPREIGQTPTQYYDVWWNTNQNPAFPLNIPVPEADFAQAEPQTQPTGTWDHSVCCKKTPPGGVGAVTPLRPVSSAIGTPPTPTEVDVITQSLLHFFPQNKPQPQQTAYQAPTIKP